MSVMLRLFLLISFSCFDCYSVIRGHNAIKDKMFEKIIQSYFNPMKQLSANFPNHQVEVQVEFQAPIPNSHNLNPQKLNGRRKFYLYRPPKILRSGSNIPESNETTTTFNGIIQITPVPMELSAPNATGKRVPVYKEDLDKIVDRIEKKISNTTKCSGLHKSKEKDSDKSAEEKRKQLAKSEEQETYKSEEEMGKQSVTSDPEEENEVTLKDDNDEHLNTVIKLLKKKGIQLRRHVPKPMDDNLQWIQLKIPKNVQK